MRQERTVQASLFDLFAGHEIGRELKAMSQWLDEDRELIGPVAEDLRRHGVKETGRQGLSAELVLRCGLLKQHRQLRTHPNLPQRSPSKALLGGEFIVVAGRARRDE